MAKCGKHRVHDAVAVEARIGIHFFRLGVFRELVGQNQRTDFQSALKQPFMGEELQHMAGKAANCALLHRHQNLMGAGETAHQVGVERLGEARIGDRRRKSRSAKLLGGERQS